MKLEELVNSTRLTQLIGDGYVTARPHPRYPLVILNYSPAASGLRADEWDNTLSYCRGLVYDKETLEVVAIPFRKFWNHRDERHPETLDANLPEGLPTIYEKLDGSFLIGFFYRDEFVVATRGSFESDQAKWATKWVADNLGITYSSPVWGLYSYIFEVIIPEDKKVVNYPFSGLVFLGSTSLMSGANFPPDLRDIPFLLNLRLPKEYDYQFLSDLAQRDIDNEEGYVATWYHPVSLRVKIKFETYKRLHRMYFQTTPEVIWELVKASTDLEKAAEDIEKHLVGADPVLIEWAASLSRDLLAEYATIQLDSRLEFNETCIQVLPFDKVWANDKETRKQFALRAVKSPYKDLLFLLLDGKLEEYKQSIWKRIKPSNERKPFASEENDEG